MFVHETVLKEEAVAGLNIDADGTYVDCTLGGAGHSRLIASKLSTKGRLIGIDQDDFALRHAAEALREVDCKLDLIRTNFRDIEKAIHELDIEHVNGVLFDLGVSSPQLDQGERGFSYHVDAPLDMRMDQTQTISAYHVVNEWTEQELIRILFSYGEEKFSRRIAAEIVKRRTHGPLETTFELVDVIKKAIPAPARRTGPHPARRTFQAIRIAVNDELYVFEQALAATVGLLKPGGRISVITFHSLEDRICKKFFQTMSKGCTCPPDFPICTCNEKPILKVMTRKPVIPTEKEIEKNQRARSAKLRVAEKI
ncbi:16S rRNA (cytosine(1402)-N(4))-methyltransferase RsmH [Hazenella sp. IB182357]|uniref:Ribosomal RNA small subunit methyltransferase H n=1 Tax=Polycladospora coralii TaxID=2771432 RepID=A0A926N512_9BACL|nr:16S rRNA (cytosine(1402)-N(4))-methyltransferase RsmH [Polycladospora coralii]MBS7530282.1 16S rRNA (cytosine(1402)-N(4))-methyltransferase RsmH [Polycladospora coralii]